jgi:hypothetical protein
MREKQPESRPHRSRGGLWLLRYFCRPVLDTVANALLARYPECVNASEQPREGGLVHRLDWGTSGVLVAARSRNAYSQLRAGFLTGGVKKRYWAMVHGQLSESKEIDLPIESMPGDRRRVRVAPRSDRGQPASSTVAPLGPLPYRPSPPSARTLSRPWTPAFWRYTLRWPRPLELGRSLFACSRCRDWRPEILGPPSRGSRANPFPDQIKRK